MPTPCPDFASQLPGPELYALTAAGPWKALKTRAARRVERRARFTPYVDARRALATAPVASRSCANGERRLRRAALVLVPSTGGDTRGEGEGDGRIEAVVAVETLGGGGESAGGEGGGDGGGEAMEAVESEVGGG